MLVPGDIEQVVRVTTSPTTRVRVSLDGFRPLSELFTSLQCNFDGVVIPVEPGKFFDVTDIPFPCRVVSWTLLASEGTDAQLSLSRSIFADYPTFTPVTGTLPTLANVIKASGDTSDWSRRDFSPGDIIRIGVQANSFAKRLELGLRVVRLSN